MFTRSFSYNDKVPALGASPKKNSNHDLSALLAK